jgi:prevent-host-death family protein
MLVNMHEAKTHLSRLIGQVEAGETVVIGRAGRPVARLVPYAEERLPRQPGALKGRLWVAEDFDSTDEDLLAEFEGAHVDS